MKHVDTLLHARWVIPVEPDGVVHEHFSVAILHGHIADILPSAQARSTYSADTVHEFPEHALIPGLINAHTHSAMSLFRGLADDLPLMEWLTGHIWPAESKWVDANFVSDGTQLAMAEMLQGGTTCFNDMYFFPDQTAQAAAACGMRAVVGMILIDFPTAWANNADEYLRKGLALHDQYQHHPLINTAFAPHAPYTVSNGPLERIQALAEEMDVQISMHVHETADEIGQSLQHHTERPIARLQKLGLLSPRLGAVHMTQLTEDEIALCAHMGVHVIHCPESNMKLASGFCPVQKLLDASVNVALGTDGAASNNDLDMLGEMRIAALLAKAVSGNAAALPAHVALRMATLNGARALGLEEKIGSLVTGKAADICAVYLGELSSQPLYHPISQLVYSTDRHCVSDVWVAGKQLLKNRILTTLNQQDILMKTRAWQARIAPAFA